MATQDEPAEFEMDEHGNGLNLKAMKGKKLTDEQARTVAMIELSQALIALGDGAYVLSKAVKKSNL